MVTTLEELTEDTLIKILTQPRNALVKQFQQLFRMEDVELEVEEDALKAIAQRAIKRRTGARGLRSIVEHALLNTMYDLPSRPNVAKVILTADVIEHQAEPKLVYRQNDGPSGPEGDPSRSDSLNNAVA